MKKPTIRVTKWLGDIPVTAECTACPDVKFQATSASHRPNKLEYQKNLQQSFDSLVKAVHAQKDPDPTSA